MEYIFSAIIVAYTLVFNDGERKAGGGIKIKSKGSVIGAELYDSTTDFVRLAFEVIFTAATCYMISKYAVAFILQIRSQLLATMLSLTNANRSDHNGIGDDKSDKEDLLIIVEVNDVIVEQLKINLRYIRYYIYDFCMVTAKRLRGWNLLLLVRILMLMIAISLWWSFVLVYSDRLSPTMRYEFYDSDWIGPDGRPASDARYLLPKKTTGLYCSNLIQKRS